MTAISAVNLLSRSYLLVSEILSYFDLVDNSIFSKVFHVNLSAMISASQELLTPSFQHVWQFNCEFRSPLGKKFAFEIPSS